MTKNKQIIKLFAEVFKTDSFSKKGPAKGFTCQSQRKCKVNSEHEAIYSPILGDSQTRIMIVGEAPSSAGGTGPHIGGCVKDYLKKGLSENEEPQNALFRFVKKYYKTTPYFTNLMKCGVSQQTKEKKKSVFEIRTKNCAEHFLLKEIEIIDPEVVLCVGKESRDVLQSFQKNGRIKKSTKLVFLIHYSKQAGLPLTIKDKEKVIWPLQVQVGKLPKEKIFETDFFKNRG